MQDDKHLSTYLMSGIEEPFARANEDDSEERRKKFGRGVRGRPTPAERRRGAGAARGYDGGRSRGSRGGDASSGGRSGGHARLRNSRGSSRVSGRREHARSTGTRRSIRRR